MVQSADLENSKEEKNPQNRWQNKEAHDSSYSDSDEEEETRGIVTGIY